MSTPLREILASFGIDLDTAALQAGAVSIGSAIDAVNSLGRAVAASALVAGTARFVQSMIDTGSELHDTSAAMGLSATELAGWRHAAGMAGVDAGQLSGALSRVSVIARNNAGVFHSLGVATRTSGGELRTASELLEDVGAAIGSIENETERTARAVQIFGRSGRALIPLFSDGATSVAAMREEVRQLYGTDLDRLAEVSDAAGDAEDRLALRFDALRTRLALDVIPTITSVIDRFAWWGTSMAELTRNSRVIEGALVVLGAVAVGTALATIGAWGPPVAIFLLAAAAVGVVIGVVDDLLVLFAGGESVIGDFLDEVFGVGAAAATVEYLTQAFEGARLAIQNTYDALVELLGQSTALRDLRNLMPALFGPVADAGLNTATGSPAEEYLRRAAEVRAETDSFVTESAVSNTSTSSRSVTTGPIYVTGGGDPVETGRAVSDAIAGRFGSETSDAAADLVPVRGR